MTNTQQARNNAINSQIRPWGGLNYIANNALKNTPREMFVPEKYQHLAFADIEIPLNDKAKMFSPKIEGRLLDALNIQQNETVLEIGTGSGYLTAAIATLCASVTSIEIDETLSNQASERMTKLGINNVKLKVGDASKDWETSGFFDVVVVGASVPKIKECYFHLLNVGGRFFVVEGVGKTMSAKLITRLNEHEWGTQSLFETRLDAMQGLTSTKTFEF